MGGALLFTLAIADLSRAPSEQWTVLVLQSAVHGYQVRVSPWAAAVGVKCRFEPSCSRYGSLALARHGTLAGLTLTLVRVMRCGPWTDVGTVDLPPD